MQSVNDVMITIMPDYLIVKLRPNQHVTNPQSYMCALGCRYRGYFGCKKSYGYENCWFIR